MTQVCIKQPASLAPLPGYDSPCLTPLKFAKGFSGQPQQFQGLYSMLDTFPGQVPSTAVGRLRQPRHFLKRCCTLPPMSFLSHAIGYHISSLV